MESIFKDERMYMSDSEGIILNLDDVLFDDICADFLRKLFINIISRFGVISVADIIEAITDLVGDINGQSIKTPSYLSGRYVFTDYNFFKFELDHKPRRPGDTLWKLKIILSPVEEN